MEAQSIYNLINFKLPLSTEMEKPNGTPGDQVTPPIQVNYSAFAKAEGLFICPSDPNTGARISENNYRYNFGGSTPAAGAEWVTTTTTAPFHKITDFSRGNGAFTIGKSLKQKDFPDGLSNTVFFSERDKGSLGTPGTDKPTHADIPDVYGSTHQSLTMINAQAFAADIEGQMSKCASFVPTSASTFDFTGMGRWDQNYNAPAGPSYCDGWPMGFYMATQYNHVAPPNWQGYDCAGYSSYPDTPGEWAIVAARSSHKGIVNACFGDGHITSVSDTIDTNVWRALGTRESSFSSQYQGNLNEAAPRVP